MSKTLLDDASSHPSTGYIALFLAVLKRDLLLAARRRSDMLNPLIFFLMVASLFPLGISPEPGFLAQIAPGVVWVGALLATLLSMDSLFRSDFDDGTLEQTLLSPQPLVLVVFAKVFSHWMMTGLPLTLLAPLLGVMLFLPAEGMGGLVLSLLLGTPTLSLIGAIGAALTVGLRKGGVLISLLVLPLYTGTDFWLQCRTGCSNRFAAGGLSGVVRRDVSARYCFSAVGNRRGVAYFCKWMIDYGCKK